MWQIIKVWLHNKLNGLNGEYLIYEARKRELDNNTQFCQACESLRWQLEQALSHNQMLVEKITHVPTVSKQEEPVQQPRAVGKRFIPHAVRREMMTREDNKTVDLMKKKLAEMKSNESIVSEVKDENKPTPIVAIADDKELQELENELLNVERIRESESGISNAS